MQKPLVPAGGREDGRELSGPLRLSSPRLGINPSGAVDDPEFTALLAQVGVNKPANFDAFTIDNAQFVETFPHAGHRARHPASADPMGGVTGVAGVRAPTGAW